VKIETRGYNQDGTLVIKYRRSVMVWRRDHAPSQKLFPDVDG
jgi:itaconyl-CoA hydratase